jgi:hypothetical protein
MSTIKLRRSGVGGKIPTPAQLDLGEVALNTYDGRIYIKKSVNSVESIVALYGAPVTEDLIYIDSYTGTGTQVDFALSYIPKDDQYVYVSINGVQQHVSEYSLSGSTITFTSAPLSTDEVEIRIHDSISSSVVVRDYQQYVYSGLSSATQVTGADDNGVVLAYDVGKVEVYANGVRLVDGLDYTATNGTIVAFVSPQTITGTVEVVSLSRATFTDRLEALVPGTTALTTTTANQVVDTFPHTANRTAKYLIQMTSGTDYHATEVLLIHDGTTVHMTEYGTIFTNASLGTVNSDISGGSVRLLVTPANINTTVKIQRLSVTV